MARKFCITTKGLTPEQKKEFATDLSKFVEEKKSQFEEESQEKPEDEE